MSCEVINPTAALPELGRHIACTYTTDIKEKGLSADDVYDRAT